MLKAIVRKIKNIISKIKSGISKVKAFFWALKMQRQLKKYQKDLQSQTDPYEALLVQMSRELSQLGFTPPSFEL